MPDNESSPNSSLVRATYHSIEKVTEITGETGWDGEFRQLSKGRITSRWQSLRLGPYSLLSHRLDKRINVCLVPPRGCLALVIVPPPHFLLVDGTEVVSNEVLLLNADSEAEFVTPNEAECETLVVPRSLFESSTRALFPRMPINGRPTRVFHCAPSGWLALQQETTRLLRDGQISPEDVSNLLTRYIELMAGNPENCPMEKNIRNDSARRVARRAQEYIEEHYTGMVRMEDLCRHSSVSLRTLQRSFAGYLQVSPSDYIKARRLNAARKGLLAASPNQTVTRVAVANGFTHLGRFSVAYHDHFGELPRATLARRALREGKSVVAG